MLAFVQVMEQEKQEPYVHGLLLCALDNPGTVGAVFAPTGALVRDVVQRSLEDFWETNEINYEYRASPLPEYKLNLPNGEVTVLCRSMESWQRIIGVNLSFIGSDELDTTKSDIAQKAIEKFLGRLRAGQRRQLGLFLHPKALGPSIICLSEKVTRKTEHSSKLELLIILIFLMTSFKHYSKIIQLL